ncbi:hypothetical protein K2173_008266 [Erythroxylum novogranatense]|uniref:Protein kinase domain-containing protein n=1 Tax=Erythroxylum novogranatense TaxID=1862640 RepID=A0AAV8U3L7_9ROSI|nr:hypothetical protein K2173_008266 [Erythroxylum novogranatense]
MTMDLKSLELLDRHLDNVWNMLHVHERAKEEWEIDPKKLLLNHVIARGTYATVHGALYEGRKVAVKVLDWGQEDIRTKSEIDTLRRAFMQEVSVWNKLDHPNICKFMGAFMGPSGIEINTNNGTLAAHMCGVVTEYCPGGTLKSHLTENLESRLAFSTVMDFALDLARGLVYLHSRNLVHRDLKTENMLLDENQTLKITDFGVARIQATNNSEMTGFTGTLGYMAPEVFESKPYTSKCDVYSFGICLWEMYCCDVPYRNLSFSELTSAVTYKNLRPSIPKCCPKTLATVMKRCWDADPNKRPEMEEVVTMLEAIKPSKGNGMIPLDQRPGCSCFLRTLAKALKL